MKNEKAALLHCTTEAATKKFSRRTPRLRASRIFFVSRGGAESAEKHGEECDSGISGGVASTAQSRCEKQFDVDLTGPHASAAIHPSAQALRRQHFTRSD